MTPENRRKIEELHGPILVLGASGFIGANLFRMLLEVRTDVSGTTSRYPAWRLEGLPQENVVGTDLVVDSNLRTLLDRVKPATVFNCVAYGAYSFERDTSLIYRTNLTFTVTLLEELATRGIRAYVHAGTSSEYGAVAAGPSEETPLAPIRNSYPLSYWVKLLPIAPALKSRIRAGLAANRRVDPVISMRAGNLMAVGYKPDVAVARERNVREFNQDVAAHDGYVYATGERLSCRLSNGRMSRAIVELGDVAGKRVLDIGCGDGTYSRELVEAGAAQVVGIDAAEAAVHLARTRFGTSDRLRFEVLDIYALAAQAERYDVAVVRGFLHHLYDVERAIDRISGWRSRLSWSSPMATTRC